MIPNEIVENGHDGEGYDDDGGRNDSGYGWTGDWDMSLKQWIFARESTD